MSDLYPTSTLVSLRSANAASFLVSDAKLR